MAELKFNVVEYSHYQSKVNEKGDFERFCAYCSTDVFFENTIIHFSYRVIEPKNIYSFCEYEGMNLTITVNNNRFNWAEQALRRTRGNVTIDHFKTNNANYTTESNKKWITNYFLYSLLCDKFSDKILSEYNIFPEEEYQNQELIYKR